jgi:hypothetical protein
MSATIELKYFNSFWLKKMKSITDVAPSAPDALPNHLATAATIGQTSITFASTPSLPNIGPGQAIYYTDKALEGIDIGLLLPRKYDNSSKGGFSSVVGKGIKGAFNLLKTQEDSAIPSITEQIIKLSDAEKILLDYNGDLKSFSDIFTNLIKGTGEFLGNQVLLYLQEQNGLLEEINTKTSLTGTLSEAYRKELSNASIELINIGIGLSEIADASTSLISQTGKFKLLNEETWVEGGKVAKAFVGSLDDMVTSYVAFEKVGYGTNNTNKILETVSKNSIGVGIESRRVTKDLRENIGKLNEFGFKNGAQGLGEMIKKSIELRTNLQSTFTVANKLFDSNSAFEMSAKLQSLGGAIGDFGDPLKLMYMATNDVEGLQDAIIGASQSLAVYNSEQGKFEITGANLRIARDRADALGIDYTEFTNLAIAANERVMASSDLLGAKIGGKFIDEDLKEFLTNMAQMDKGELKITIPGNLKEEFKKFGSEISLKEIGRNPELLEAFKTYQDEFKKLSKEQIIENQASSVKNIERYVSYMAASIRIKGGQAMGKLADIYGIDPLKEIKENLKDFTKTENGKVFGEAMIKKISDTLEINIDKVRESLNGETISKEKDAKDKKQKEAEAKEKQQVIKHEVTVLVKNDGATLDAWTREIGKSPSFTKTFREKVESLYTNNNNVVSN